MLGLKELLQINTKAEEEALYQQYKAKDPLLSVQYLPGRYKLLPMNKHSLEKHILMLHVCKHLSDSHGNMDPDMKPFWYLCIVASSFIMLSESTENTLYNMAQVASLTQLVRTPYLTSYM